MKSNKKVKLLVANAIVDKLWHSGLLTEEQRDKIKECNKTKILSSFTGY